jgi:tetraacyldisaccharide 4'-kinase
MSLATAWYRNARWLPLLRPLSILVERVARKRFAARHAIAAENQLPVPVIVVGNISVGGTGKTPLTIALVELLRRHGWTPGVISRGYGAKPARYPWPVTATTPAHEGGDEPCLLARRTGVPLYIAPDRVAAAHRLLQHHPCDVLISDDGLQHYPLPRTVEIAVIDGARGLGNGRCLPEGPLREPPERLRQVDLVIVNGPPSPALRQQLSALGLRWYQMELAAEKLYPLAGGDPIGSAAWPFSRRVDAVAGIGHPARFFQTLRELGFEPIEHPLADHARLSEASLEFASGLPLIMTEKDAVKCSQFNLANGWALRVEARLDAHLEQTLLTRLTPGSAQPTGHNDGPQTA